MKTKLAILAAASAALLLAGNGDWTKAQAEKTHGTQITKDLTTWVDGKSDKDCGAVVAAIIGNPPSGGAADVKFNGKQVFHLTKGAKGCTLFYTTTPNGSDGQIVGIGFHDENAKGKYKTVTYQLDWSNPAWRIVKPFVFAK
jgi:hypothetical protein